MGHQGSGALEIVPNRCAAAMAGQQVSRQDRLGVDNCFPSDLQSGLYVDYPHPDARTRWGGWGS